MTAKETKIKEAYGDKYQRLQPDENGWFEDNKLGESTELSVWALSNCEKNWTDDTGLIWRLTSLKEIETNNGWITIESEKDLPPDGHYWTINILGVMNASPKLVDETCNDNQYWLSTFTHYQPIVKPKPPIY